MPAPRLCLSASHQPDFLPGLPGTCNVTSPPSFYQLLKAQRFLPMLLGCLETSCALEKRAAGRGGKGKYWAQLGWACPPAGGSPPSLKLYLGLNTQPGLALFSHLAQSFPPGLGSWMLGASFRDWCCLESQNSRSSVGEIKDFPGKELGKKISEASLSYFQRLGRPQVS